MRAVVLRGPAGSGDVVLTEVDVPDPGQGEALVRISRTGMCASDVHLAYDDWGATAFTPMVLGHETAGVVERLGPATSGPVPGTRVSILPILSCGNCRYCATGRPTICERRKVLGVDIHGTYAEHVVVPVANLITVPDSVVDELAAIATDAIATAYHATATRGTVGPGRTVAVWGTGGVGLAAVGIARCLGADRIFAVDPRADARRWATEGGADDALEPSIALAAIRSAGGVDTAIEAAGTAETSELAVRSLAPGGRAVLVGAGAGALRASHLTTFVLNEREVVGSYGSSAAELATVLELLSSGRLTLPNAIGDSVALEEVPVALTRLREGRTSSARIVVRIGQS